MRRDDDERKRRLTLEKRYRIDEQDSPETHRRYPVDEHLYQQLSSLPLLSNTVRLEEISVHRQEAELARKD